MNITISEIKEIIEDKESQKYNPYFTINGETYEIVLDEEEED